MRFLADECCDALITRMLRAAGHDVFSVAETMPGSMDDVVLNTAYETQRVILTEDRDFCELIFRDQRPTHGIVLIRIADSQRREKSDRILFLVNNYAAKLEGAMTTLTVNSVRI